MKSPFPTMRKATRLTRKGRPLSAALLLQRTFLSAPIAAAMAKPVRRRGVAKAKTGIDRPAPGTFVEGDYGCAQGRLHYRLYTPVGSTRRRLPMIVMLHGCTQTAADFAAGTAMNRLADELGFLVLYPEQSARAHPNRCWNWHRPSNRIRGSGEAAVIAGMTRQMLKRCKGHEDRVYIAGISAGGAAAAVIAAAYPKLYAAVGVHSGVAAGEIGTISEALTAMRGQRRPSAGPTIAPPPMILFHGDRDRVVHPSNAGAFVSQLRRSSDLPLDARSEQGVIAGGRSFTRTLYRHGRGPVLLEEWTVHGSGHAWSGGSRAGSHTDPDGPDASRAMATFFLARRRPVGR